jgi:hypothetical protein
VAAARHERFPLTETSCASPSTLAGLPLTRRLLPRLLAAVNIVSVGWHPLDFDTLALTRARSGMRACVRRHGRLR